MTFVPGMGNLATLIRVHIPEVIRAALMAYCCKGTFAKAIENYNDIIHGEMRNETHSLDRNNKQHSMRNSP